MRFTSHKNLLCNKLCNCLFSVVLTKRPAQDAWSLWPVSDRPDSGRLVRSGRVGGVQSLDATSFGLVTLDRQGVAD